MRSRVLGGTSHAIASLLFKKEHMALITIPEIYLNEIEKTANSNHRQCQELEAIIVEQKDAIAALKNQLRKLAEKQNLEVLSHPELAIAIIESYTMIEQRNLDAAKRLSGDLKRSNSLGDRYSYSKQNDDLQESRRRLKGWRSLLDAVKRDAGDECDRVA